MTGEKPAVREALTVYAPETVETDRVPKGYKQTEVGVIPEDWEVAPVGSMGEVVAGKALAAWAPGLQRPYLRTKNVFDGRIDTSDVLSMPMTDAEFDRYELHDGDVLLNEGQTLELVGRCSIYQGEFPESCAIQNQLVRFRARSGVSAMFATHLFRYCQKTGVFARIALQTTSVAHLGVSRFQRLTLPWPPLHEQRAIAAALSDVDDLISALDGLIAKKRAIKTAAMQQLLTGKQRLPGFSGEWEVKRLGDIGSFSKGKGIKKDQVRDNGIPCVRYGEIYTRHNDYIKTYYSFISHQVANESHRLRKGDLLFAGSGETAEEIGKCVAFLDDTETYAGGDIVVFTPISQNSLYLGYLMNHASMNSQKARMGQGDAVVHISANNLSRLELHLPEVEEQTAIAAVLSDMDAEIKALQARREKTRQVKRGMMQELLTGRTRLDHEGASS